MELADSVATDIGGESFATGVTVASVRNPVDNLENLRGTRFQVYPMSYDRERSTRASFDEIISIEVSVEKRLNLTNFTTEVDTASALAFQVFDFLFDHEVSGWDLDAEATQEPIFSLDEARQTSEFKSVQSITYRRTVTIG